MQGGQGLAHVPTRDLRALLSRLHQGHLVCPITHQTLVVAGLAHLVDRVPFLSTLDATAVRAVLVAVLAERAAVEKREQAARRAAAHED